MGGDGEQGSAPAPPREQHGQEVFRRPPVRQVKPSPERQRGTAPPGQEKHQASAARQDGQGPEHRRGHIARQHGAARRQAAGGGAGVRQAARIAQQPQPRHGARASRVPTHPVLP
jgi:hypothetical protein